MVAIIGEGTYGCVTKPSLKCDTPHEYKGRVSKLMLKEDAIEELKEMERLVKIPNIEKYILRMPKLCNPETSAQFYQTLQTCQSVRIQKAIEEKSAQFRLLLLDDGGVDLYNFLYNILQTLKPRDINIFLTSILHLFEGVSFFLKHNIIHHDIKLPNIVYNVSNGEIKFIDFGIMISYTDFIRSSNSSQNDMAQTWDYFPPEYSCANQEDYLLARKCKPYRTHKYDTFLKKTADTFDSFCLAFCLKSLFISMSRKISHIHRDFFIQTIQLLEEYTQKDVFDRNSDLNSLFGRYKILLKQFNVYSMDQPTPSSRSKELSEKYSVNHINKQKEAKRPSPKKGIKVIEVRTPDRIRSQPKKLTAKHGKHKGVSRRRSAKNGKHPVVEPIAEPNAEPNPCPPGKERNPKTGRCVKIKMVPPCPPGKERNPKTGRCVQIKKNITNKMNSPCPPGKERNPITKRCRKIIQPKQPEQKDE